jgi:uncharacterized protein
LVRRAGAGLAALALAAACGDGEARPDGRPDSFDRRALLRRTGELLTPAYQEAAARAAALAGAVDAWCGALGGADAEPAGDAARQAWRDAIDAWQVPEAVLIGPAAMSSRTLRHRIYAWPDDSTCGVDQTVVARWNDPDGFDVAALLPGRRSLTAVEYLLFAPTLEHTCASQSAPPGWATMADADRLAARCGLAADVAADVAAHTETVRAGWAAYLASLVDAPVAQASVNVVSDALFYVDAMVKDMKLGEAAGIVENFCGTIQEPCLLEVEHRFADHGKPAIAINLATLRAAFTGTIDGEPGIGFADFLAAVGAEALAARMVDSLDGAIAAVEAIDGSLLDGLAGDYPAVVAAHAAVKRLTDDLKSQFLTVLGLDIPQDVASDND